MGPMGAEPGLGGVLDTQGMKPGTGTGAELVLWTSVWC